MDTRPYKTEKWTESGLHGLDILVLEQISPNTYFGYPPWVINIFVVLRQTAEKPPTVRSHNTKSPRDKGPLKPRKSDPPKASKAPTPRTSWFYGRGSFVLPATGESLVTLAKRLFHWKKINTYKLFALWTVVNFVYLLPVPEFDRALYERHQISHFLTPPSLLLLPATLSHPVV